MVKLPLALVSSDWHVRKLDRVWYRRDEIYGDCAYSISQIGRIADDYDVPAVILAGDIFDAKLNQADALRTMRLSLDSFQEQDRRVLFVEGQHERSTPALLSALHPWPEHMHEFGLELAGYLFYGLDYCNPSDVEEALKGIPDNINVLITHQVWKDFLGDKHGDAWLNWVNGTQLVISGDYHRSFVNNAGGKRVLSPGSICMQDIGEQQDKYVYILYDDLSAVPVLLRTRNIYRETINTDEQLEEFLSGWYSHPARIPQADVSPNIATNLLRITYSAALPQARQRIEATVGTSAHLFTDMERVQAIEQFTVDQARRCTAVMQGGVEGCISEFYADDTNVRDNAVRLARTANIQTELLSIYKEILDGTNSN